MWFTANIRVCGPPALTSPLCSPCMQTRTHTHTHTHQTFCSLPLTLRIFAVSSVLTMHASAQAHTPPPTFCSLTLPRRKHTLARRTMPGVGLTATELRHTDPWLASSMSITAIDQASSRSRRLESSWRRAEELPPSMSITAIDQARPSLAIRVYVRRTSTELV